MQSPFASAKLTAQAVTVAICPPSAFFARSKLRHRAQPQHRIGNRQNKRLVVTGTYSTTKPAERPASFKPPQLPDTAEVDEDTDPRDLPTYLVLPQPATYQQTLRQSFTVGGLGYHSGEYAHVRVRPAHAGEGRYFVRKPLGTNSHLFRVQLEEEVETYSHMEEDPEPEPSETDQDLELELYFKYLQAQANGFDGTWESFVDEEFTDPHREAAILENLIVEGDEMVVSRSDEDDFLLASLDKVPLPESRLDKERAKFFTTLAQDKYPPPPILPQISQFFNEYQEMPNRPPLEQTPEELMRELRREAADFNEVMESKNPGSYFDETPEEPEFFQGQPNPNPTEQEIRAEQEAAGPWVQGAEHLLAALEGMGVDNARIEIEGGFEVPIIDGSSLGWVIEIQKSQTRPAITKEAYATFEKAYLAAQAASEEDPEDYETEEAHPFGPENHVAKQMLEPKQAISLRRGESWMMFFPQNKRVLTYGLDYTNVASVIGKQWYSWAPFEDDHFRWGIAPARTFNSSPVEMVKLKFDLGLMKGGSQGCANNAHGHLWTDMESIRFPDDEPVRHKILDLLGDISLMADDGHTGFPLGHIIAYNADHSMHIEFLKALKASCSPNDWIPSAEEEIRLTPPPERDPVQARADEALDKAIDDDIDYDSESDEDTDALHRDFGRRKEQTFYDDDDEEEEEEEDKDVEAGDSTDEDERENDDDGDIVDVEGDAADDDEDQDDLEGFDSDDDDGPSKRGRGRPRTRGR